MKTDLELVFWRKAWLTVYSTTFFLLMDDKVGRKNILSELFGVDPKTVSSWDSKDKINKAVRKYIYKSGSVTRDQEINVSARFFSLGQISDEHEVRKNFGELAEICRDFEITGFSALFERMRGSLNFDFLDKYSVFYRMSVDVYEFQIMAVVLAVINSRTYDEGRLVAILKNICSENQPHKGEPIGSDQWKLRQKKCFMEYVGESLSEKLNINKADLYHKSMGSNLEDSASKKWYRWTNEDINKGKEKVGMRVPLLGIISNLGDMGLLTDEDCCQLIIVAYKVSILSWYMKVDFDGISIPESMYDLNFRE
ncbi:MAG: hypothetical protein K6L60_12015 [Oceanobacter sp.]